MLLMQIFCVTPCSASTAVANPTSPIAPVTILLPTLSLPSSLIVLSLLLVP